MLGGDALDDRQAQTGALAAARAVAADERVEDVAQLGRIDARAAIQHAEHHVGRRRAAGQAGAHLDTAAAVAQGVLHQVGEQALDRHPAQRHGRQRLQAQAHALLALVERRRHLADQLVEVELLQRLVAAVADEGEELVEDRVHVLDVADHVLGQLVVGGQQLQRQAQAGQRRAQVVGHPGEHQLALAGSLLDVLGHLVEGAVQLGHLARRVAHRQAHAAAAADLAGGEHQALERQAELAYQQPGRRGGQQADGEEPAKHAPDALHLERIGIQRHLDPVRTERRRQYPQARRALGAHAQLGVLAQLLAHLRLQHLGVGPVVLTGRHLVLLELAQAGGGGDRLARGRVGRPVGAQGQRGTVAVLAVDQHVLVHQQVDQGQRLGEQHDDQHQPEDAGEHALREPDRGSHLRALPSGTNT
ncbi:hypothetical protein D3C78_755960 [compost metagenome]